LINLASNSEDKWIRQKAAKFGNLPPLRRDFDEKNNFFNNT
jgi:hypothetical protein